VLEACEDTALAADIEAADAILGRIRLRFSRAQPHRKAAKHEESDGDCSPDGNLPKQLPIQLPHLSPNRIYWYVFLQTVYVFLCKSGM
jgi:hypothetical protein